MTDEAVVHLPAELSSVAIGRRFVREVLSGAGLDELADDGQLATSELVANAVRHAGTQVVLRIRIDDEVIISVEDGHPELRRPVVADSVSAESGRGLRIVDAVSTDWGVTMAPGGKTVWFSLARPDTAGRDADVRGIGGVAGSSRAFDGAELTGHPGPANDGRSSAAG